MRSNTDRTRTEHGIALDLERDDYYTGQTTARCECCDKRVELDTMAVGVGGFAHCHACINGCVHCGLRLATHEDRDTNPSCDECCPCDEGSLEELGYCGCAKGVALAKAAEAEFAWMSGNPAAWATDTERRTP